MKPITTRDVKLGFIGIGYMGRPIAQRLLQAGFSLMAYDRNRAKAEELIRYGGVVAEGIADVASGSDVLLSCLPSDEAVVNVHLGASGALASMRPDSLVIEMSTVSPETSGNWRSAVPIAGSRSSM
jgi:3-hydroxyisobutyrate dehydrogenase-like beta-hydroxyacid dehydrogenase